MTLRWQGREADLEGFLHVLWPGAGFVAWHFIETVGLDSLVAMGVAEGPAPLGTSAFIWLPLLELPIQRPRPRSSADRHAPAPSDRCYLALTKAINASPFNPT